LHTGRLGRAAWTSELTELEQAALRAKILCQPGLTGDPQQLVDLILAAKRWVAAYLGPCPRPGTPPSRDELVHGYAQARGLPVIPLETAADTIRERDEVDSETGGQAWIDSIRAGIAPHNDQEISSYVAALNDGDLDIIIRTVDGIFSSPIVALSFRKHMVVDRNQNWMLRLLQLLSGGGAVIVVGAAHLPGPGGLINLLQSSGFDVQPVLLPAASQRRN
jgi:hypothetical protein